MSAPAEIVAPLDPRQIVAGERESQARQSTLEDGYQPASTARLLHLGPYFRGAA